MVQNSVPLRRWVVWCSFLVFQWFCQFVTAILSSHHFRCWVFKQTLRTRISAMQAVQYFSVFASFTSTIQNCIIHPTGVQRLPASTEVLARVYNVRSHVAHRIQDCGPPHHPHFRINWPTMNKIHVIKMYIYKTGVKTATRNCSASAGQARRNPLFRALSIHPQTPDLACWPLKI